MVVTAAEGKGCEVTVCGEMGSHSKAAVLLLGLGIRHFSMVPARIPRIKQVLGRIEVEEAREVAERALSETRGDVVRELVTTRFSDRFHHGPDDAPEEANG